MVSCGVTAPDLPPLLEDPTGFPDGVTAEVERRPPAPVRAEPLLDVRRFALLLLLLVALAAGSLVFLT